MPDKEEDKSSATSAAHSDAPAAGGVKDDSGGAEDEHRFSVKEMILHPSTIPKLCLESVADTYWVTCSRQLNLVPLHFKEPALEVYYVNYCMSRYPHRVIMAMTSFLLGILTSYGLVLMAYGKDWIFLYDAEIYMLNHVFTNLAFWLVFALLMATLFRLPIVMNNLEFCTMVTCFVSTGLVATWGTWGVYRTYRVQPIQSLLDYSTSHPIYDPMYWIAMFELSTLEKAWYEFKMMADAMTTALFFTQIVLFDTYFPTRTKTSVWFHIAMCVLFGITRLLQMNSIPNKNLKIANVMDVGFMALIYVVGWAARWFRELQERSNILRVRESQQRLESVKNRFKKRRFDQSAAEEILDLLKSTRDVVGTQDLKRAKQKGPNSLREVSIHLQTAIDMLAEGDKKGGQAANPVFDPATADEAVEEDAFLAMFTNMGNTRGGAVPAGVGRKKVGGGAAGVKIDMGMIKIGETNFSPPSMLDKIGKDVGQNVEFKLLEMKDQNKSIIVDIGFLLLSPYKAYLDVEDKHVLGVMHALHALHWRGNPYHSSLHGASVAHIGMCLMNEIGVVDYCVEEQIIGFLLAGLGHAVGHAGRNNMFFVQSDSLIAFLRNDLSIVEAMSTFILLSLLAHPVVPELDILGKLPNDESATLRKYIVEYCMCIDVTKHFELVSKSRVRRAAPDFSFAEDQNDRDLVTTVIMKAADLGHSFLDWNVHMEWILRLQEEYYQQGADEAERGLAVSPICDRRMHSAMAKVQAGYMQLVVTPLIEEISSFDTSKDTNWRTNALFNKQKWEKLRDGKKPPAIPNELQTDTAPGRYTLWCAVNVLGCKTFEELIQEPSEATIARS